MHVFSAVGTANVAEKRSQKSSTLTFKNQALHEDLIKNADQDVLQTQPICHVSSEKDLEKRNSFFNSQLCTPLPANYQTILQDKLQLGHNTRKFSETPICGSGRMWDLGAHAWRKRKRPCTKQCAWRKHGSCDTRLCAQSGHFGSTVHPKAPGRRTMPPSEALLPRNPTWESSHSGLTKKQSDSYFGRSGNVCFL